ncbi:MAG: DNA polymerase III subunit gamma/tau [bacterium]
MTFYRTYRPQTFASLIGQEAVSGTLQQALLQERVGHAYLFSGPRGTGKTSAARIFARALVCLSPVVDKKAGAFEPCNACEACLTILDGQTSDLIEIDAASNRGIEDIRELREQVQYHPMQLKRKIYIIDEVHMLTVEAFNALLKTLEEPPEYSLFILATTELHKVPLTIRSRCQSLRFKRASNDSLAQKLRSIADAEKLVADPAVYELLAEHADGAFRDAETMLESLSTQHKKLTVELVEQNLGLLPKKEVDDLIGACLTGDYRSTLEILHRRQLSQSGAERLTSQLIERLRAASFARSQGTTGGPALKSELHLELAAYALDQLLEAYILQRSAPIPSLPLEIACLNVCQHADGTSIQPLPELVPPKKEVTPKADSITSTIVVSEAKELVSTPPPTPEATVPVVELNVDGGNDPRKAWRTMIDKICQENIVLGQSLKQAVFHKAENGVITIHVRYKFHVDKMSEKKNHLRIHALLEEASGQLWEVRYEIGGTMPRQTHHKEISGGVAEVEAVFGPSK